MLGVAEAASTPGAAPQPDLRVANSRRKTWSVYAADPEHNLAGFEAYAAGLGVTDPAFLPDAEAGAMPFCGLVDVVVPPGEAACRVKRPAG
jgi:hypothetical protein